MIRCDDCQNEGLYRVFKKFNDKYPITGDAAEKFSQHLSSTGDTRNIFDVIISMQDKGCSDCDKGRVIVMRRKR
jgi:hypothetical protein